MTADLYCYIEDGKVASGAQGLPTNWRDKGDLSLVGEAEWRAEGWVPVVVVPNRREGEIALDPEYKLAGDHVVMTLNSALAPVVPPEVPEEVLMVQARLALFHAGLLAKVEDIIAAMPEPQRTAVNIEWEYHPTVRRDSALTKQLGEALGLSVEQIDALFIDAAAR